MELVAEHGYKTYKNHRQEPYFTYVKNGVKTIEGRLQKGLYSELKPGDHILVYKQDESEYVEVVVLDVRRYRSFAEMLDNENIQKILPDVQTNEAGVMAYRKFYSVEKEVEFGVLAIEVELISVSSYRF